MAMTKFHDFDQAWDEHQAALGDEPEPIQVKLLGEKWQLPGDMPAAVQIHGARLFGAGERSLTMAEIIHFTAMLVPQEILDRWLAKGIGVNKLAWMLMRLLRIYMRTDTSDAEGGGGEGEAERPPAKDSPGSSKGGRSSKPTSNASTELTSIS
jgi:hypothetical protein